MDEKEIQATMDRLGEAIAHYSKYNPMPAGSAQDIMRLAADALVKFTRLVEAVECIASCQIDVAEAIEGAGETLETAQTEGSC